MKKMADWEEDVGLLPSEKHCAACGRRGYYLENGLCMDCLEAELRRSIVLPSNGFLKGGLNGG